MLLLVNKTALCCSGLSAFDGWLGQGFGLGIPHTHTHTLDVHRADGLVDMKEYPLNKE